MGLSEGRLFPHQVTGAAFLAGRRFAILADSPGLGKTATAVTAADRVGAQTLLMVVPAVVRNHWAKELSYWAPRFEIEVVEGYLKTPPRRGVATVVSHAVLAHAGSYAHLRQGAPYDVVIVDEIHFFRGLGATRRRALFSPVNNEGLYAGASYFWGLSGTPLVNSAADLWPWFFGPMGRQDLALDNFCHRFTHEKTGFAGLVPTGVKNTSELADLLRPYVTCRTLESIGIALPTLDIQHATVPLDPDAMAEIMADLSGWSPERLAQAIDEKDDLKDAAIARVRRTLGIAKAPHIAQHVSAILQAGAGPVVVFFQHTDVRAKLYELLKPYYVVSWIDGKITRSQLAAAESWFQAGKIDVLLVQTDAGGVGITLHRAHRVVVAELPWTAVSLWQAIKRVHRIGQAKACVAEIVRAGGVWLEEVLAGVVARKHRAAKELMDLLTTNF